jgi:hypothetical protein
LLLLSVLLLILSVIYLQLSKGLILFWIKLKMNFVAEWGYLIHYVFSVVALANLKQNIPIYYKLKYLLDEKYKRSVKIWTIIDSLIKTTHPLKERSQLQYTQIAWNFQSCTTTFKQDIDPTRAKNNSFGKPNFSIQTHYIYLIYFCLKEHVEMYCLSKPFFLNSYFLSSKKESQAPWLKKAPKIVLYQYKRLYI